MFLWTNKKTFKTDRKLNMQRQYGFMCRLIWLQKHAYMGNRGTNHTGLCLLIPLVNVIIYGIYHMEVFVHSIWLHRNPMKSFHEKETLIFILLLVLCSMCNLDRVYLTYCKCPKISKTKLSDKMTYGNSADPDQTAPLGAV